MTSDFKVGPEHELRDGSKVLSGNLFHYTSSDAAILGILANRTIRLSPFHGTNDLWESRPLYPTLRGGDQDRFTPDITMELWDEVDRYIRMFSKVACFTEDWDLPDEMFNRDALRGWSHLSLWAHYGQQHSGVCLRFDRQKLLGSFEAAAQSAVHQFSGHVRYRATSTGTGPDGIDLDQLDEFGVDAVALHYAATHHRELFFSKHVDWSNESEFRLVRTDLSLSPFYVDISEALNGVFLGDDFPADRIPALKAILEPFEPVEIYQLGFHNRELSCYPFESEDPSSNDAQAEPNSKFAAKRGGGLGQRLDQLRTAEAYAATLREPGATSLQASVEIVKAGIESIARTMGEWPGTEVKIHPSVTAVPERQLHRAPGVPGEVVGYETGLMVVAENHPQYTFTFVVALALQAIGGQVRLHGVVLIETWREGGNLREELWRTVEVVEVEAASAHVAGLFEQIAGELNSYQVEFDTRRAVQ